MKIEKINDYQIRCYITSDDLLKRHMKLSELAYGTEKARSLFNEMMHLANKEYGFGAEDYPLMIEAVPLSDGTVLLTITKVSFPDELDSRFAYFSDTEHGDTHKPHSFSDYLSDAIESNNVHTAKDIISVCENGDISPSKLQRHFIFNDLDTVISVSKILKGHYLSSNSLYKDTSGSYHLIVNIGNHSALVFNKVCNVISEYGEMEAPNSNSISKIIEHANLLIDSHALQTLSEL